MKLNDLTNKRFGKLTVVERVKNDAHGKTCYLCKCLCGNYTITTYGNLKYNHTSSCGCNRKENKSIGERNTTHGSSKTRLYRIWHTMKNRCYNCNSKRYNDYGSRGIEVCNEWLNDFSAFRDWSIQNGYQEHLTIDRINNDGNYEPNNCRWVSNVEQQNNKRNSVYIQYRGETKTLAQWSKILNKPYNTLRNRLQRGWSIEQAFGGETK